MVSYQANCSAKFLHINIFSLRIDVIGFHCVCELDINVGYFLRLHSSAAIFHGMLAVAEWHAESPSIWRHTPVTHTPSHNTHWVLPVNTLGRHGNRCGRAPPLMVPALKRWSPSGHGLNLARVSTGGHPQSSGTRYLLLNRTQVGSVMMRTCCGHQHQRLRVSFWGCPQRGWAALESVNHNRGRWSLAHIGGQGHGNDRHIYLKVSLNLFNNTFFFL